MSRSHRLPYFTDQQRSPGIARLAKRAANKAVRAANKKAIDGQEKAELASGRAYRKASDSWSIRDWSFFSPEQKKAHRK